MNDKHKGEVIIRTGHRPPRQDWSVDAACRNHPYPDIFFPIGDGTHKRKTDPGYAADVHQAKLICGSCPVIAECLSYAMAQPNQHGIWGGLTEEERKKLKKTP